MRELIAKIDMTPHINKMVGYKVVFIYCTLTGFRFISSRDPDHELFFVMNAAAARFHGHIVWCIRVDKIRHGDTLALEINDEGFIGNVSCPDFKPNILI